MAAQCRTAAARRRERCWARRRDVTTDVKWSGVRIGGDCCTGTAVCWRPARQRRHATDHELQHVAGSHSHPVGVASIERGREFGKSCAGCRGENLVVQVIFACPALVRIPPANLGKGRGDPRNAIPTRTLFERSAKGGELEWQVDSPHGFGLPPLAQQRRSRRNHRPHEQCASSGSLGKWSEAGFSRAFHTCEAPSAPCKDLRGTSADELETMWLYLKSQPVGRARRGVDRDPGVLQTCL